MKSYGLGRQPGPTLPTIPGHLGGVVAGRYGNSCQNLRRNGRELLGQPPQSHRRVDGKSSQGLLKAYFPTPIIPNRLQGLGITNLESLNLPYQVKAGLTINLGAPIISVYAQGRTSRTFHLATSFPSPIHPVTKLAKLMQGYDGVNRVFRQQGPPFINPKSYLPLGQLHGSLRKPSKLPRPSRTHAGSCSRVQEASRGSAASAYLIYFRVLQ